MKVTFLKTLWIRFGAVLAVWTLLTFILTAQTYLLIQFGLRAQSDLPSPQTAVGLVEVFANVGVDCLVWSGWTLVIFWLGKRFPFSRRKWPRSLLVHVAACFLCGCFHVALMVLAFEFVRRDIPKPTFTTNVLFYFFLAKFNSNVFFYWAILGVYYIVSYYRQLRERELRESQLEAKLAQTQLQILKMQLQPHFLFNTLNAISALIHKDVELADQMVARLGDLLRTTLENANRQEVSLQQELDFIGPFLEIEKARLGQRLTVEMDIEPAAVFATVPNLILQPLVENAIRHGIAPRPEPGKLAIHARLHNGSLQLAVQDDGPGLKSAASASKGIGLANTRARLEKLYGDNQKMELNNNPNGGFCVAITIPFHRECPEAS